MIYDHSGKKYKIFGQDDHDSLKIMKKYLNILFISGDRIGFRISKKRVEDIMGIPKKLKAIKNGEIKIIDKYIPLIKLCLYSLIWSFEEYSDNFAKSIVPTEALTKAIGSSINLSA